MRGRFVALGGTPTKRARFLRDGMGIVGVAFIEFVNAEVAGKYWLPSFQRTEFQSSFALLGQTRPVFRLVSSIRNVSIDDTSSATGDSAYTPRLTVSWAPPDSISSYAEWDRGIGSLSGSVHADDFHDMTPDEWRLTGRPRFNFFATSVDRMMRFNRVEGLFTGVAPSVAFRSMVPGLTAGVHGGWAWTEKTARGGAFATYRRANTTLGVRAERQLAGTNDFTVPFGDDPGFGAAFASIDNNDYVDRRLAMMSVTRVLRSIDVGLLTMQLGMAEDRQERARLTQGLFAGDDPFRLNRGSAEGPYVLAKADLELRPRVSGDFAQPGVGARLRYEIGSGDLDWQRLELMVSARKYFGPISLGAHGDAGLVFSDAPPPQTLFELGGNTLLPGYAYKEFAGNRAALLRTFASYRFNLWKRPMRIAGNLHLPSLSPGVAVSAQGGWTELSSPGAIAAVRQFAPFETAPVSEPTHGMRTTVGGGLTLFSDLVHVGAARAVDRPAKWRFVIGFGPMF
jgi:hypothetical protein